MNSLIRWQHPEFASWRSLGGLSGLRDEIDRLFDVPLRELTRTSQLLSGWNVALDVYEDADNVYVKAEVPGMKKEDINLSLHDGSLSISGERKSETSHEGTETLRTERYYGRFQRTVTLPTPVAVDKVKAQYKDGILTVTLPKAEEAKPKHIDVHVA